MMNRDRVVLISVLVTFLSFSAGVEAQAGRVLEGKSFRSEALGRDWAYSVYLPGDYERSERAYPVVYLLHGVYGGHGDFVRYVDAAMIADGLIERREIVPLILVMPDGGNSYWLDSDPVRGYGAVETAFVEDLIPHIEATYRTIATRRTRSIAGLSMGGYGALRLTFRHPDLFGAAAALSPAIHRTRESNPWTKAFGDPYDPAKWAAESPFAYLPGFAEKLGQRALPVFLWVGDDDELTWLLEGTTELYRGLRDAGLAAELRVVDGGHSPAVWSAGLRESLKFFDDVLHGRR